MRLSKLVVGRLCITLLLFSYTVTTSSQVVDTTAIHNEKYFLKQETDSLMLSEKDRYAPGIISSVSYYMTKKFGWFSANDILYSLPDFAPSQDYDRRTVSFRGMFEGWNNNHILTLMDGIPFNDNLYGSAYTWENTPLIFSKSYDISRGPAGALYGNNAMNGVISFNTIEAPDVNGIGNVRVRFGSHNTLITDVLSGAENKSAGIVTSFTHYSTDGNAYNSYDLSGRAAGGSLQKFKVMDEQDNHYFFVKAYGKGKYKGLSLQYHEQHWDFQTGHGWLFSVPDLPEAMSEYRRLLALKYAPYDANKKFNYELSARYQDHGINWNMRFFPDNSSAYGTAFPNGVTELLNTSAKDIFVRLQGSYHKNHNQFIAGVEGDYFTYGGDKFHTSNIDLNTGTAPGSTNQLYLLNSWLEYIKDKPVKNIALFARYISPNVFNKLQFNLSARYNNQFFTYTDINQQQRPEIDKSFTEFSPEGCIVFTSGDIVLKAIAGKAFRTPSPTEMFGANTYTLASNINQLKPELVTNYDLSFDWKFSKSLYFRTNGFLENFRNQIAYSVANANLSTNIYTLKTAGIETELNFKTQKFSGFFNYSFNKRIDEDIADSTISNSNKITWAPANVANVGTIYSRNRFYTSLSAHYQSKVYRRATGIVPAYEGYRPSEVAAWVNLDCKVAYKINAFADVGIVVKNVTGETQYLIKNNAAPFDYRRDLRRAFVDVNIRFKN